MKKAFKTFFRTQGGRFVAGLLALIVAASVMAGVNALNGLKFDVTDQQTMTPSEESKEIIRGIDENVTILYLAGDAAADPWVEELAGNYAALNRHITYQRVDPAAMGAGTGAEGTLMVVSAKRNAVIQTEDLYAYSYDLMYYYMYGQLIANGKTFVADEALVNALVYVTDDDMPVVYMLRGHGENSLGSMALAQIQNQNVDMKTLTLTDQVPEDAKAIVLCAPKIDLSDAEAEMLKTYLAAGGDLVLLTDYALGEMSNLRSVMAHYGMKAEDGVILDIGTGYCYQAGYPQYLTPDVAAHPVTDQILSVGMKPVMQLCGALERADGIRDGVTVRDLMTTSAMSYRKGASATTAAWELGDEIRPFSIAMAAEEGDTRIVWMACTNAFADTDVQISGGINLYLIDGFIDWMLPQPSERIAIEEENLMAAVLTVPEDKKVMMYAAVFAPALVMLIGWVIFRVRRKK